MSWIKSILNVHRSFPADIKVAARFINKSEGELHPAGYAVSGDQIDGEMWRIASSTTLQSGETLAKRIQRENIPELTAWVNGMHEDPVPRAILRLLDDATARSLPISEEKGINVFWSPGQPPQKVYDGPATLAQIINIPIHLFFETDGFKVVRFEP